jgi:hypothetical protein
MRWIIVVAAVVFASACSDDPTDPDPIRVEGAYTLQTINGRALPIELFNLSGAFIIRQTGGKLFMNAARTFREEDYLETRFTDPQAGLVVEHDTAAFIGTWESQDSVVTWTVTRRVLNGGEQAYSETMFGVVNQNRLTLNFESGDSLFTFVYRRD